MKKLIEDDEQNFIEELNDENLLFLNESRLDLKLNEFDEKIQSVQRLLRTSQ